MQTCDHLIDFSSPGELLSMMSSDSASTARLTEALRPLYDDDSDEEESDSSDGHYGTSVRIK